MALFRHRWLTSHESNPIPIDSIYEIGVVFQVVGVP